MKKATLTILRHFEKLLFIILAGLFLRCSSGETGKQGPSSSHPKTRSSTTHTTKPPQQPTSPNNPPPTSTDLNSSQQKSDLPSQPENPINLNNEEDKNTPNNTGGNSSNNPPQPQPQPQPNTDTTPKPERTGTHDIIAGVLDKVGSDNFTTQRSQTSQQNNPKVLDYKRSKKIGGNGTGLCTIAASMVIKEYHKKPHLDFYKTPKELDRIIGEAADIYVNHFAKEAKTSTSTYIEPTFKAVGIDQDFFAPYAGQRQFSTLSALSAGFKEKLDRAKLQGQRICNILFDDPESAAIIFNLDGSIDVIDTHGKLGVGTNAIIIRFPKTKHAKAAELIYTMSTTKNIVLIDVARF